MKGSSMLLMPTHWKWCIERGCADGKCVLNNGSALNIDLYLFSGMIHI